MQAAVPDSYIWIVAPDMNLGEKEFRVAWDIIVRQKNLPVSAKSRREKWIELENGSKIEVRTEENPDQLVGEGVDLMIVAEAARLHPMTWEELLRPTLGDKPGRAIFTSTPRGRNFFYRLWQYGQNPEVALRNEEDPREWASWQLPSSVNPLLLRSDIERVNRLIEQDPISHAVLRQEWRAEFVTYQGVVFPEFLYEVHVRAHSYEPGMKTMLWGDPGLTNPYSLLLVQITGDETVRVLGEIYKTGKTSPEMIEEAVNKWPYALLEGGVPGNPPNRELEVVIDPAAADAVAAWRLAGYNAYGEKPPLKTGIEVHRRMLRDPFRKNDATETNPLGIWPRITFDPSCEHTIEEHNLYHYPDEARRRTEAGPSELPVDADNHSISAIRYGTYAVFPELFNEYHPTTDVETMTDVEMAAQLGIDLGRMQIEDGPRLNFDQRWNLGDY